MDSRILAEILTLSSIIYKKIYLNFTRENLIAVDIKEALRFFWIDLALFTS